ncbi:hypothetical protein [Halonotius pteroides]|nr:hypothetical protein [Halonotius pteroides]
MRAAGQTTGSGEWRVACGVPTSGVDDRARAAVDGGDNGCP